MIEVYLSHDRPLLFASKDAINQLYLTVLLSEDDDQETEEWMHVPVSYVRLQEIRSGTIDLKAAFKQSESGKVIIQTDELRSHSKRFRESIAAELTENQLPKAGERLKISSRTLPQLINETELAAKTLREIFSCRLEFPYEKKSEAPTHILGNVLISFQEVFNSIVPDSWSNVVAFEGGSFKVVLASRESVDLFDSSNLGVAVNQFEDMFRHLMGDDNPKEYLSTINIKMKRPISRLVKNLSGGIEFADLKWASPKGQYAGTLKIEAEQAQSIWQAIREESEPVLTTLRIPGILKGLNLKTKYFLIESAEDARVTYSGYMVPEALNDVVVQNAQMNHGYVATIEESYVELDDIRKFTLLKLDETY